MTGSRSPMSRRRLFLNKKIAMLRPILMDLVHTVVRQSSQLPKVTRIMYASTNKELDEEQQVEKGLERKPVLKARKTHISWTKNGKNVKEGLGNKPVIKEKNKHTSQTKIMEGFDSSQVIKERKTHTSFTDNAIKFKEVVERNTPVSQAEKNRQFTEEMERTPVMKRRNTQTKIMGGFDSSQVIKGRKTHTSFNTGNAKKFKEGLERNTYVSQAKKGRQFKEEMERTPVMKRRNTHTHALDPERGRTVIDHPQLQAAHLDPVVTALRLSSVNSVRLLGRVASDFELIVDRENREKYGVMSMATACAVWNADKGGHIRGPTVIHNVRVIEPDLLRRFMKKDVETGDRLFVIGRLHHTNTDDSYIIVENFVIPCKSYKRW